MPQHRADPLHGCDMEPVMTCDANAAVSGVSASQSGDRDSGDPAETGRRSGASLGFAYYEIIVDIGREASTAHLVRRDSRAGMAATGVSSVPWGSDFCAMLLAMVTHDLRQPLQIIMAAHDTLDLRLNGEPERRQLARIERAATKVANRLELLLQALRLRESTGKTRARTGMAQHGFRGAYRGVGRSSAPEGD
jgi:hypothetical protein